MRRKFGLLRRDEGSALVEFATILGLIILSGAAAVTLLGSTSEKTFAVLSEWGMGETDKAPRRAVEGEFAFADDNTTEAAETDGSQYALTASECILTVIFSAVGLCVYLVCRRRTWRIQREDEEAEADREILDALDNKRFVKRQEILKVLASDPQALFENRTEVRHLMTTRIRTVRPKTTTEEMRDIMQQEHVRHFPVITDKGMLVGIVSDRDLLGLSGRVASDLMTRSLITVSPTTKINSAVSQMVNRNISCLPVMQEAQLVGMLTTTDVVMTLQCALQLLQRRSRPADAPVERILA
jgi:CBS domain-containing protein